MKALQAKAKFGDVREISAVDYVDEVNKAGEDIWVVLHLYKSGYPFQFFFPYKNLVSYVKVQLYYLNVVCFFVLEY